jgi:hypothetical protein
LVFQAICTGIFLACSAETVRNAAVHPCTCPALPRFPHGQQIDDRRVRWHSKGRSEAGNNCGIEPSDTTSRLGDERKPCPWRAGLPSHVASTEASSGRTAGCWGTRWPPGLAYSGSTH